MKILQKVVCLVQPPSWFSHPNYNFPCSILCRFPLILLLCTPEKGTVVFSTPFQVAVDISKISPSLSLSQTRFPQTLIHHVLQPLSVLPVHHQAHSSTTTSLSYSGPPNWTLPSGLRSLNTSPWSAKQREEPLVSVSWLHSCYTVCANTALDPAGMLCCKDVLQQTCVYNNLFTRTLRSSANRFST